MRVFPGGGVLWLRERSRCGILGFSALNVSNAARSPFPSGGLRRHVLRPTLGRGRRLSCPRIPTEPIDPTGPTEAILKELLLLQVEGLVEKIVSI